MKAQNIHTAFNTKVYPLSVKCVNDRLISSEELSQGGSERDIKSLKKIPAETLTKQKYKSPLT